MMPRKMFRLEREEITGVRGKLHSEELHDLYCSRNIIQVIK
jgi:hypothetical protein